MYVLLITSPVPSFNVFVAAKQGRHCQGFVCMCFQVPNLGNSADRIITVPLGRTLIPCRCALAAPWSLYHHPLPLCTLVVLSFWWCPNTYCVLQPAPVFLSLWEFLFSLSMWIVRFALPSCAVWLSCSWNFLPRPSARVGQWEHWQETRQREEEEPRPSFVLCFGRSFTIMAMSPVDPVLAGWPLM